MNERFIEGLVGGKRYVTLGSYVFDKLIFAIYILFFLLFFLIVFFVYGGDRNYHVYYVCNAVGDVCQNPFYLNYPLCYDVWDGACLDRTVPNGFSFGKPIPFIYKYWTVFLLIGFVVALLINHLMNNKNLIR